MRPKCNRCKKSYSDGSGDGMCATCRKKAEKDRFLKVGDVVEIKDGMHIVASVPSKYRFSNTPESEEPTDTAFEVGSILNPNGLSNAFHTGVFKGQYVVVRTAFTGGGKAMFNDYYPDGHKVCCKKLKEGQWDPKGTEIEFFQSGSFQSVIQPHEIKILKTMKMVFV